MSVSHSLKILLDKEVAEKLDKLDKTLNKLWKENQRAAFKVFQSNNPEPI